jgi:hypothetical protein
MAVNMPPNRASIFNLLTGATIYPGFMNGMLVPPESSEMHFTNGK